MMSMDAIHAKEGGEDGEIGGNIVLKTIDCLWVVHES
jgi:hypothetical protein